MFYGDYHTHTCASDSPNTVKGNVEEAIKKGLKEIAITDHGFNNKHLALTPRKFRRQAKKIAEYREIYKDISILHGVEADIVDTDGTVDMSPEQMDKVDILLCGFHRFIRSTSCRDYFRFVFYNGFLAKIFKPGEKTVEMNTAAFIRAIEKYPIDIITHLNDKAKVHIKRVCETAATYGTLVELNIKHLNLLDDCMDEMLQSGCTFIVNSDAHLTGMVGKFERAVALIEKYNIPEDRIANLNKRPVFTRLNEYKKTRV